MEDKDLMEKELLIIKDYIAPGKKRTAERILEEIRNLDRDDLLIAEKIAKRLSKVVIENKSFTDILTRYDKEGTLFYCDPPYYKAEKVYHMGDYVFDKEQHILLRDSLKSIKGHFVLSYNDDEFIKNLYEGFDIQEVERSSNLSLNNGKKGMYKELIITNF